jgi:hypothetical protein
MQQIRGSRDRYRTDFNRVGKDGRTSALYGFGGSNAAPRVGDVVELFDGDENACLATVERVEEELLRVRILPSTWRPGARFEVVDLMEALKASLRASRRLPRVGSSADRHEDETGSREPRFFAWDERSRRA